MKWTELSSCLLLLLLLLVSTLTSTQAEPGSVTPRPQENKSRYPDPVALFSGARAAEREGALLLLKDYTKQGDTLLKERLKDSYSNLKDMLKQGDSVLKEQLVEGVAQLKEQRKEGDERLKEELNEDVAWLKDRLAEGQTRMKEEMAEEEAKVKEELAGQREAVETLKTSVRENSAVANDDLKHEMSAFREELKNTKLQLQKEMQMSAELKSLQQTAEEEILSLKVHSQQCSHRLDLLESSDMGQGQDSGNSGSTFIRWGRTTCPDNTSLVYSGVAGGDWYDHTGGGSNYLCLVSEPQLDNRTQTKGVSHLHGSEYEDIIGEHDDQDVEHDDQDVVCSVCRAPQPTTIMIPATLTCPSGWTPQYKGHLVAGRQSHKGRTEYVCLDDVREHGVNGHENKDGALMYHVVSRCVNLPCPPYVDFALVTCVVCSM